MLSNAMIKWWTEWIEPIIAGKLVYDGNIGDKMTVMGIYGDIH